MTYTGGARCDGYTERSTSFHFECDPMAGIGEPSAVFGTTHTHTHTHTHTSARLPPTLVPPLRALSLILSLSRIPLRQASADMPAFRRLRYALLSLCRMPAFSVSQYSLCLMPAFGRLCTAQERGEREREREREREEIKRERGRRERQREKETETERTAADSLSAYVSDLCIPPDLLSLSHAILQAFANSFY